MGLEKHDAHRLAVNFREPIAYKLFALSLNGRTVKRKIDVDIRTYIAGHC